MKQRIIDILSAIFQAIDTLLCKMHIKRPKVIVFMDGGICSQMLVYIQGMYYAEQGLDVCYDLTWYAKGGKDQNGIMPRYFEFDEMWPSLECKTISGIQRKWYLLFFQAKRINGDWLPEPLSIKRSIYFGGFWDMPRDAYKRLYAEVFDKKKPPYQVFVKIKFLKIQLVYMCGVETLRKEIIQPMVECQKGISRER